MLVLRSLFSTLESESLWPENLSRWWPFETAQRSPRSIQRCTEIYWVHRNMPPLWWDHRRHKLHWPVLDSAVAVSGFWNEHSVLRMPMSLLARLQYIQRSSWTRCRWCCAISPRIARGHQHVWHLFIFIGKKQKKGEMEQLQRNILFI